MPLDTPWRCPLRRPLSSRGSLDTSVSNANEDRADEYTGNCRRRADCEGTALRAVSVLGPRLGVLMAACLLLAPFAVTLGALRACGDVASAGFGARSARWILADAGLFVALPVASVDGSNIWCALSSAHNAVCGCGRGGLRAADAVCFYQACLSGLLLL